MIEYSVEHIDEAFGLPPLPHMAEAQVSVLPMSKAIMTIICPVKLSTAGIAGGSRNILLDCHQIYPIWRRVF